MLLVLHSLRVLSRPRASVFWLGVLAYGLARGVGVRWVSTAGLGGSFPYVIREPLLVIAGVSLQEVIGWAIVLYLGWWLGAGRSARLFVQLAVACLFLAAASWGVESAAIAAGWWRWTVPVPAGSLTGVPFIGIVDWFLSGTDFLLPFLAITAPALRARPQRYLTLLAFPLHFGAHLLVQRPAPWFPIPIHHLAHWLLLGGLVWLALRSTVEDRPFQHARHESWRWVPSGALGIMLGVLGAADLMLARRPALLVSLAPLAAMTFAAALPSRDAPGTDPRAVRSRRRAVAWILVCAMGLLAFGLHAVAARRQKQLTDRIDRALALRDRGELEGAAHELRQLTSLFPDSHVPHALLGEIRYRSGALDEARRLFATATQIQQNYADGFRYLAVIDIRRGDREGAARWVAKGLEIEPQDPQLAYLGMRVRGTPPAALADRMPALGAQKAFAMAALAFEVDDLHGAGILIEAGLASWPAERAFHAGRVKLALASGDRETARRAVREWLGILPQDPEARAAAVDLGLE